MSELKTNKISPATGTALAVGDSGDTITVPSGATLTVDGTLTFSDGSVTNAKLANMAANTVKVRDANSSGVPSDKALASTEILIGDGTGFTAAALSGDATMANTGAVTIADNAVTLAKLEDGTQGDILYYAASGAPTRLAKGAASQLLTMNSGATAPEWAAAAASGTANQPNFQMASTSDFQWTSSAYAEVPLTTLNWESDTGSCDVSTNYRFTVPSGKGGKYMIVNMFPTPSSGNGYFKCLKNTSEVGNFLWQHSAGYGGSKVVQAVWTSALAAGDYLEWWVYSDSNANQNGTTYISGWRLEE